MPRPIVEIHQKILNQVITPNDPEQSVCIVGLNTINRSEAVIGTLEFSASDFESSQVDSNVEFSVEEQGVIVNSDLDLGRHTIDGDLSCTLSDIQLSVGNRVAFRNFSAFGTKLGSREIVLSGFTGNINTSNSEYKIHVSPASTLRNVVKVSSGSGSLNLGTGAVSGSSANPVATISAISGLVLNSTLVTFLELAGSVFKVIARDSSSLYLYGTTKAAEDELNDASNDFSALTLVINGVEILGFRFSITAAENQVVSLDNFNVDGTAVLSQDIKFCSVSADGSNRLGEAVVSTASANSVVISELDNRVDKLTVVSATTGDATFKLSKNRLFSEGVVSATVKANYTVALTGLSDRLRDVDSVSVDLLGTPSTANQLALAAKVALSNAGLTKVKVLALDLTPPEGSGVSMKTLAQAYSDALVIINNDPDVYAICPLTTDIQVIRRYKDSAEAMSAPKKGKFRIVLGTSAGPQAVDFIVGSPLAQVETGSIVANTFALADSTQNFRASSTKVMENDTIVVIDSSSAVKTGLVSFATSSTISVTWDSNPAVGACTYYVMRDISGPLGKDRQIELLASVAAELSSSRLLLVYPGICSVSVDGVDYANVDAFYLTAGLAGMLAGLEPHRPKNSINVASITGIVGSNLSRFNDDQIDAISDSGYFVFIQDTVTSAPYCVHQVMTKYGVAKGVQELTELSVVNNFDFVSRFFKRSMEPFLGTYNITTDTLGLIRATLDSSIATLRLRSRPQIGSPLLAGTVELVRQADYDKGTVEARVSVSLPKVLNKIVLELVSA